MSRATCFRADASSGELLLWGTGMRAAIERCYGPSASILPSVRASSAAMSSSSLPRGEEAPRDDRSCEHNAGGHRIDEPHGVDERRSRKLDQGVGLLGRQRGHVLDRPTHRVVQRSGRGCAETLRLVSEVMVRRQEDAADHRNAEGASGLPGGVVHGRAHARLAGWQRSHDGFGCGGRCEPHAHAEHASEPIHPRGPTT